MLKEQLAKLLASQEGILLAIVLVMIGVNIFLTSARKLLGWLHLKTESKVDDRAYAVISRVLGWSDVALQFLSANSAALPPKVKQELDAGEWHIAKASEALQASAEEQAKQ